MPPLAVGATASDHPEVLWRVVNLLLKVRARRVNPEFQIGLETLDLHLILVRRVLWRVVQVKVLACRESDPLLFEC